MWRPFRYAGDGLLPHSMKEGRRFLQDNPASLTRRYAMISMGNFGFGAQERDCTHYKLLDSIGQGRMAGVYKAVHRLGQVVAVKVLPPSKAKDKQAFARFYREARIALRLKHPNIVR